MSEKPEALRLADAVDQLWINGMATKIAAELRRLHAECEALRADAGRLDWLLWKLPGDALRYCVGELSDTSDGAEFRAAVDAAMAKEQTK